MQFDRAADGVDDGRCRNPSIDTGAGLERVAAVLQGVRSRTTTPTSSRRSCEPTAALAGSEYGADGEHDVSHARDRRPPDGPSPSCSADGVIPGNEGRGYVLRRILRRAVRHGMNLGFEEPFLNRLGAVVGEVLGDYYPELGATETASVADGRGRGGQVPGHAWRSASQQVQTAIDRAARRGSTELDGETVFRFYDTHGLPAELIREIAEEERFSIDERLRGGHEEPTRARSARRRRGSNGRRRRRELVRRRDLTARFRRLRAASASATDGAQSRPTASPRVACRPSSPSGVERRRSCSTGTPFYAESGGQVGDTRASCSGRADRARRDDTQKDRNGSLPALPDGRRGRSAVGDEVDGARRSDTPARRRSATTPDPPAARRAAPGTRAGRPPGRLLGGTRPAALRFHARFPPLTQRSCSRGRGRSSIAGFLTPTAGRHRREPGLRGGGRQRRHGALR